ncbi:DegT/DnrJ/EryC1/StrS family aminotransferase [Vibrio tapetis]|nr:DegT/DnrJ/EryC1/StrS family aminotransferase [Vibrio tapetis]
MSDVANKTMQAGNIASGDSIRKFELALEKHLEVNNLLSVNNMTSAIALALDLIGIEAGDEVITTSFNCLASTSPIALLKAKAVWVDLDKNSVSMSIDDLQRKISNKTKAVILYHAAGYPSDSKRVSEICKDYNIPFIEDCNNALFANCHDKKVGTYADYSIYSFYPNRQINTLEGAMLSIKDTEQYKQALKLRRFGIDGATFRDGTGEINPKSQIKKIGTSINLGNINCAIGLSQLEGLKERHDRTLDNARLLTRNLRENKHFKIIKLKDGLEPSYWGFLVLSDFRDELLAHLKSKGVAASKIHFRNDLYEAFDSCSDDKQIHNTVQLQERILALPIGYWLIKDEISYISNVVNEFHESK